MIYTSECGRYKIVEWASGSKEYWKDGKRHRDGDLPAYEEVDGTKEWYKDGKLHRDGDLPAVEYSNGDKLWYKYGKHHRDGDLPALEWASGYKEYWKDGIKYNPFEKLKIKNGDILTITYEGKDREIEKDKIISLKCKIYNVW